MWCFMWHLCFGWKMPIACIVCTKLIFSLFRLSSTTITDTHSSPLPRYQSLGKYANVVADHKISHYANELNREGMKFSTVSIKYPQNMPYITLIGTTVLRQGAVAAIRHKPGACKNKRNIRKLSWTEINENIICLYVWFYVDDLLWNISRNTTAVHHASDQKKIK